MVEEILDKEALEEEINDMLEEREIIQVTGESIAINSLEQLKQTLRKIEKVYEREPFMGFDYTIEWEPKYDKEKAIK